MRGLVNPVTRGKKPPERGGGESLLHYNHLFSHKKYSPPPLFSRGGLEVGGGEDKQGEVNANKKGSSVMIKKKL